MHLYSQIHQLLLILFTAILQLKVSKVPQINGKVLLNVPHVGLEDDTKYLDNEVTMILQHHSIIQVSLHLDVQEPTSYSPEI